MKYYALFPLFLSLFAMPCGMNAQVTDSLPATQDSLRSTTLQEVTITAFSAQSRWQDAPAAIAVISNRQMQLLAPVSLVPVFNTVAGVRMEERSPGSYRLSIRGSLLRSPYGIRNVKIYWNDIPLTDAGGNTYLNLVDISQVESAEIIKGPASSLYGANTGGAVILHSGDYSPKQQASVSLTGGSYGLFSESAKWSYADAKLETGIQQVHQQSDGYRQHSSMRKDVLKWDGNWQLSPGEKLSFLTFYSDLYYQTPGGLTSRQLYSDTTAYPRAVLQQNAIYNKTLFAGISLSSLFSKHFDNLTTLTGNHTSFKNPFTTNYEVRDEGNSGFRTAFSYHGNWNAIRYKWLAGSEWLHNHSMIDNYDNNAGKKGEVQYKDELFATQYMLFTQLNTEVNSQLTMQAGISDNRQIIRYRRRSDANSFFQQNKTAHLIAPRISALYRIVDELNAYAVMSKGFSTPTLAEFHPSDGTFNDSLQTEYGWNYEAGIKGSAWHSRLLFDASVYTFGLRNAIVRRSTATADEWYVNAGRTRQQGFEVWVKGLLISNDDHLLSSLTLSNSFSYQPYRFLEYQVGTNDYSGNRITGVPRTVNVTTMEATASNGLYANLIFNYTSSISLNDAATAYAGRYHLLQAKVGIQQHLKHIRYNLFAGADNLFNETYSLGNDINAFGGRYYNPAAKRNYFAGIQVGW